MRTFLKYYVLVVTDLGIYVKVVFSTLFSQFCMADQLATFPWTNITLGV